jgi:predicted transcriptional regulator
VTPFNFQLLTIVAEPKARKTVAKEIGLPSGVIPVLAAVGFWEESCSSTHLFALYAAEMGAKTLIRHYIAQLVKAKLLKREGTNARRLRLTIEGRQVLDQYERAMREGVYSYGHQRPQRVLTHPLRPGWL